MEWALKRQDINGLDKPPFLTYIKQTTTEWPCSRLFIRTEVLIAIWWFLKVSMVQTIYFLMMMTLLHVAYDTLKHARLTSNIFPFNNWPYESAQIAQIDFSSISSKMKFKNDNDFAHGKNHSFSWTHLMIQMLLCWTYMVSFLT